MSAANPLPEAEIETARGRIAAANSLDEIKAIVERFSAAGTRDGAVLYSGTLDHGIYSGDVAEHLADRLKASIINETPRGSFLADKRVEQSIRTAALRIFEREGQDPITAETSARMFVFGDPKVAPEAATSVENSLWGSASKEFARSLHGDVLAIVDNARPDRVFGRVELPEALENPKITNFMGMPREEARHVFARDGFDGMLLASRAQGETRAIGLPETLRSAYPALAESSAPVRTGTLRSAGASAFVIATIGLDAAQSYSRASNLAEGGNLTAADSEIVRFATRNVGILGGAAAGSEVGAALGIESGPGAIVTGIVGGVIGAIGGNQLAKWYDESKIDNQTDRTGKTWSIDSNHPGRWLHRHGRAVETADAETARELTFRATSTAAELAIGRPPTPQDPNRIAPGPNDTPRAGAGDWQRDASTGQWHREITHVADRVVFTTRETATPTRSTELDRASGEIVARNLAQSAAATALRYQATYLRNDWERFGPMPPSLANVSADHLLASDGKTYDLGKDGRWTDKDWPYTSVASGALKAELDVTHATLQTDLASVQPALERLRERAQPSPPHKLTILHDSKIQQVGEGFLIRGTVHTIGTMVAIDTERDGTHSTTLFSRQELLDATPPEQRDAVAASLRDGQKVDMELGSRGLAVHADPARPQIPTTGRDVGRQPSGPSLSR